MLAIFQQVHNANLISGSYVSTIGKGAIILLGVAQEDTEQDVEKLASKIVKTRIFKDENGKINLSLLNVGGSVLVVSNFTLQADTSHGNRPNFSVGAEKSKALNLYNLFCEKLKELGVVTVNKGAFGQHMDIQTNLDGPITLVLNSNDIK